jgi:hypothetical protein
MSKVYLAHTETENQDQRTMLFNMIQKAGLNVFPSDTVFNPEYISAIESSIEQADCALIILGNTYGENLSGNTISVSEYQYKLARKKLEANSKFKLFFWNISSQDELKNDVRQTSFIQEIRSELIEGMQFSNVSSPVQLVDDLRIALSTTEKVEFNINPTDVFVVHNELDEDAAAEIIDMLSDIIPVEKMNIIQDSDHDYSEYCAQQIGKSKLAVIYFKESGDWALPFVQQIWKKIGGASSHTPILLIGDEDPDTNMNKKFKAPKVVSLIVSGELIPLEIKVQYDKIIEGINS